MQRKFLIPVTALFGLLMSTLVIAKEISIPMYLVAEKGHGESIGTVIAESAQCGTLLKPDLHGLPTGIHGFHVHVKADCDDNGMAAGGHFDPAKTDAHQGPYPHKSHLGDLPILVVDKDGKATLPVLAPRFTLNQLKGHALMIHAGGDNYADHPEKLGGGGARIACGLIK